MTNGIKRCGEIHSNVDSSFSFGILKEDDEYAKTINVGAYTK
jgi:hypothetical protein